MKEKIKIIVATHKKYQMPEDPIYLPVHVGAKGKKKLEYQPDNEGENISAKNPSFCELTGLYWAWKNLDCDYLGLVHYRRYFTVAQPFSILSQKTVQGKLNYVLNQKQIVHLVQKYPIIVPKKRNYYIETLYSHYAHTHYEEHLQITREIIGEKYPEYLNCYDEVVEETSGYMFNMYIMRKDLSDAYCEWLFDILFELENRVGDTQELSRFQQRFYGRVSEIIFNVWLRYQRSTHSYPVKEIGCMHMERINWLVKGTAFLKAKLFKQKYEQGF